MTVSEAAATLAQGPRAGWWVQVRGHDYGPYSLAQLTQFVADGRVRPNTPVSDDPAKGWTEARRIEPLMTPLRIAAARTEAPASDAANIFVHAEIHSGAWNGFLAALEGMGKLAELAPGFWLVRTRFSSGVIRNTLSQTLERGDRFIVVDATRDRFAWFNLGPEIDVHIKEVWNAALKAEKQ
jgi:GYF domain 2